MLGAVEWCWVVQTYHHIVYTILYVPITSYIVANVQHFLALKIYEVWDAETMEAFTGSSFVKLALTVSLALTIPRILVAYFQS